MDVRSQDYKSKKIADKMNTTLGMKMSKGNDKKKNTAKDTQNFYRDCIIFPKIYVQSITKVTKQKDLSM